MKEQTKDLLINLLFSFCLVAIIWLVVFLFSPKGVTDKTVKSVKEVQPNETEITETITEPVQEETKEAETATKQYIGHFKLTAYCSCEKCCGIWATKRPKDENGNDIVYTSTGTVATAGRTIAVDPSVIPYGTEIEINGNIYVAEDCGGAIKGDKIDVYFDNHNEALIFGVQYADIYLKA